ncbi:MFS transporter, sugar porter (SP) family [Jatrophihabitans endophyticus]|uniref:MFS transporter, sugar porter (SP) family n=1 Tax=Jatrophihabitans endophyticus TaxID=1206085 RepID=A0A1M5CLZ7_9ACTN|nr:sugar porter family MFS transporter [Jatrophihabitans endophyticus]SHF55731.1 MFS transporter, sugar porter (SP) family [Jatrophihabitans endophyticus]
MTRAEDRSTDATEHRRSSDDDAAGGDPRSEKITGVLLLTALISAIASLLYGYDTGIISAALLQIQKDFDTSSAMEQVIAGSILFGAVIGALTCSRLSERRGRRGTILLIALTFVAGAILCSVSPSAVLLSLSRIVLGFAVGGATQVVPMYVAELAPPRRRGQLVLTFQVGIGVGIVVSTIVGATESLSWRVSVGLACIPALVMFVVMLRLPESPRWLVKQDRRDDARDVLATMRPDGADIDPEIDDMVGLTEDERNVDDSERGWRGLRRPWVRPAAIVGFGIAMFTQLSGIEMIIYYAPTILTDNGFSTSAALRVSVALGVTYLVMMIVGLNIVDRIGRRRLTLVMIPGTAVSLFVLGGLFVTGHSGRSDVPFIVACLVVFMFFNAGGLQLMGWLTGSEIYPLAVRSAGTSAQAAVLWSTNLLITLTLLTIINAVHVGPTMWLYGAFNVLAWLFVWFRMPDLTGRSLEQIERNLRDGHFTPKEFAAHST